MMSYLRITATVALLFLLASSASAQIAIGFRAGVINSNQTIKIMSDLTTTAGSNGEDFELPRDNITGFVVGIPIEIGLSKMLALQTEINYLKEGSSLSDEVLGATIESKVSYGVLDIPVLAKIGWITEKFSFTAVAGPSYQYVANGRIEILAFETSTTFFPASNEKIDFSERQNMTFNRSSLYGQAGIQLGVPIANGKFVLDTRYRIALTDQNSNDEIKVKGHGVLATLGYMVTFGS